jgi:hypothetical protein
MDVQEMGFIYKKHFSPSNVIGNCSTLVQESGAYNLYDFYTYYCNYGRTQEYMEDLAKKFLTLIKEKIPNTIITHEDCIDCLDNHACIQTWNGYTVETFIISFFEFLGYTVTHCNKKDDAHLGIDMIVSKDDSICFLVQCKPSSFWTSSYKHTIDDRLSLFEKHQKGNMKYPNIPYRYITYNSYKLRKYLSSIGRDFLFIDKRELWDQIEFVTINGKQTFNILELVDIYGRSIYNFNDLEYQKLGFNRHCQWNPLNKEWTKLDETT